MLKSSSLILVLKNGEDKLHPHPNPSPGGRGEFYKEVTKWQYQKSTRPGLAAISAARTIRFPNPISLSAQTANTRYARTRCAKTADFTRADR